MRVKTAGEKLASQAHTRNMQHHVKQRQTRECTQRHARLKQYHEMINQVVWEYSGRDRHRRSRSVIYSHQKNRQQHCNLDSVEYHIYWRPLQVLFRLTATIAEITWIAEIPGPDGQPFSRYRRLNIFFCFGVSCDTFVYFIGPDERIKRAILKIITPNIMKYALMD